jgi:hypothetical protein
VRGLTASVPVQSSCSVDGLVIVFDGHAVANAWLVLAAGHCCDFFRARDNPGYRVTWTNARKRPLTCAVE